MGTTRRGEGDSLERGDTPQKWTTFYMKVVSPFASARGSTSASKSRCRPTRTTSRPSRSWRRSGTPCGTSVSTTRSTSPDYGHEEHGRNNRLRTLPHALGLKVQLEISHCEPPLASDTLAIRKRGRFGIADNAGVPATRKRGRPGRAHENHRHRQSEGRVREDDDAPSTSARPSPSRGRRSSSSTSTRSIRRPSGMT